MKMSKNAYLFAAALVAGTMGMTSCSNETVVDEMPKGEPTNIAIGMSVALPVQTKAATGADEVNFGEGIAEIKNVTIVPLVKGVVQKPIFLENFQPTAVSLTKYKSAAVLNTVDAFRVYGNLPTTISEESVFAMPSLAQAVNTDNGDATVNNLYAPHALYYYAEAVAQSAEGANKFEVATGSSAGDWTSVGDWTTAESVGTYNRIKIKDVTYAMGVFSAAVLDKVADENLTKNIFSTDGVKDNQSKSWQDVKGEGKSIQIAGMIIEGQTKDFDATFTPSADEVRVFAAANKTTLSPNKISFEDETNKVKNANIYAVVAPEKEQRIAVNFQFKNTTGYHLHLNNGEVVAPDGYFYLAATLNKQEPNDIFAAATSTLINANVLDWGKGTTKPSETVDVEIGIEIDTQWKKGIAFEEDL